MVEHVLAEHEEYAVPGHREVGVALPERVWTTMKLEELEQRAAGIPQEHFQVSPNPATASTHDKENQPVASGSRKLKRAGMQSMGTGKIIARTYFIVGESFYLLDDDDDDTGPIDMARRGLYRTPFPTLILTNGHSYTHRALFRKAFYRPQMTDSPHVWLP
ncbi:hypothetical protein EV702DRAFT_1047648 [Suillus placidus]|uniref:Uncharacterized protein n=1 Tax=Suillus placidus TaxID=48579 RepID=A0A9P7D0F8_9AGAM|nr:hypothetical protein EV702DRAFT_1047648 [Suillus placidus]